MSEPSTSSESIQPSAWLGIGVGWLAQLGLRTLLPVVVLVSVRFLSLEIDDKALWLENPSNSQHPVWYALQASVFVGSLIAGGLAARLSPPRSPAVPIALVLLSLFSTWFEQFPAPLSVGITLIWIGSPCGGLILGYCLVRRLVRRT